MLGRDSEMIEEDERRGLSDFVFSMENPSGGFNFPRDTPASIEETYFSLMILSRLGIPYSNPKTNRYVERVIPKRVVSLKHLFQLLSICDIISIKGKTERIGRILRTFEPDRISLLSDLYYFVLLTERLGLELKVARGWEQLLSGYTSRRLKPLSICHKYITVCKKIEADFDKEGLIDWMQKSQNPDGGLGFFPGTTSFLENVWYGLKGLKEMDAKPSDAEGCRRFIMSCSSRIGGFGRQNLALPTLEYSFMAIDSLEILRDMMRR